MSVQVAFKITVQLFFLLLSLFLSVGALKEGNRSLCHHVGCSRSLGVMLRHPFPDDSACHDSLWEVTHKAIFSQSTSQR